MGVPACLKQGNTYIYILLRTIRNSTSAKEEEEEEEEEEENSPCLSETYVYMYVCMYVESWNVGEKNEKAMYVYTGCARAWADGDKRNK